MTECGPAEVAKPHTRLLKCALEIDDSRAYWQHAAVEGAQCTAQHAFESYWFGARSFSRVEVLMRNFRLRFAAYPSALQVLGRWSDMDPDTRRLICHWHLQLADPLYRAFTGNLLVERHQRPSPSITLDLAVHWVQQQTAGRWNMSTCIHFASKLLSASYAAGLVASNRDPRPVQHPRVRDAALVYLMYLLKGTDFSGTLLVNPYTISVGLSGPLLEERLRKLPELCFRRQGDLMDFGWIYPDLATWGERLGTADLPAACHS